MKECPVTQTQSKQNMPFDEYAQACQLRMHNLKFLNSLTNFRSLTHTSTRENFLQNIDKTKKLDRELTIENEVLPYTVEDTLKHNILQKTGSKPLKDLVRVITKYQNSGKQNADGKVQTFKAFSDLLTSAMKEKAEGRINIDIHFSFKENGDKKLFNDTGNTSDFTVSPHHRGSTYLDAHTTETINKVTEPTQNTPPDICQDASVDTIERTQDGSTYAFKGDYYWKINYNVTAPGYPRKISDDWGGLEGNLDASLTFRDGKTYIFKDARFWSFTNKEMDPGYPKLISEGFRGIPDNLDAAIVWSGNGKPYFFKGKDYWRYDVESTPHVSAKYPSPITGWEGLPADGIDAACVWDNNKSYFFKGGLYYRFDDTNSKVSANSPPYPWSTAVYWFSCPFRAR